MQEPKPAIEHPNIDNTMSDSHDSTLVAKAQAQDQQAFLELWLKHLPLLTKVCRNLLRYRPPEDVEDLVNDVYIKAWKAIGKCPLNVSAWLCRIATNHCIDTFRHRRGRIHRREEDISLEEIPVKRQGLHNEAAMAEMLAAKRAFEELTGQERHIIFLFWQGYGAKEIAAKLGLPDDKKSLTQIYDVQRRLKDKALPAAKGRRRRKATRSST